MTVSTHPTALLGAMAAALLLAAPAARAVDLDPPTASSAQEKEQGATAKRHYQKGKALYDLSHFAEALVEFEEAYQLRPVPGLLFNIAQCHRQLGDMKKAKQVYQSYLRLEPDGSDAKKARGLLAQVEQALQEHEQARAAPPLGLDSAEKGKLEAARDVALDPPAPAPAAKEHPTEKPVAAAAPTPAPTAAVPSAALQGEGPRPAGRGAAETGRRLWPTLGAAGAAALLVAGGVFEASQSRSALNQLDQLHQQSSYDAAQDKKLRDDVQGAHGRSQLLYAGAAVAALTAGVFLFVF